VLFLITAPTAVACPLCYDAVRESLGQRLDTADRAVLAVPISGGTEFQVVEIVKRGKGAIGDIIGQPITNLDVPATLSRDPFLLLGNYPAPGWSNLGNIGTEYADWLRRLIDPARRPPLGPVDRPGMLDHPDEWRGALKMLAGSPPEGVTDAALLARGFKSTVISGLVESGLATLVTERIWADGRRVEVMWLRLTPAGHKALTR
jgi:hypothetical protein